MTFPSVPPTPRVRTRTTRVSQPAAGSTGGASDRAALRLQIVYRAPATLKSASRQLRRRGRGQVEQLALNLRRFGCLVPILIQPDGAILNGHAIWEAAKVIGLSEVPTVSIADLTEAEASALRISLNRLQELSSWDEVELKSEIELLSQLDFGLVGHIGFSTPQIDLILSPPTRAANSDPDDRLPSPAGPVVSRRGDLWLLEGGHRLLCADACEAHSYAALMAGERARLAACDLPYNVPIRGHVSGQAGAREFAMASGEMSVEVFTGFLQTIFTHCAAHSLDGAFHLQFMDWRHMVEMMTAGTAVYGTLKNLCVWTKDNAGMGSLWRSQHELCFVWKVGQAPHVNNVELGRHGRHRSNVWAYPGANTDARSKAEAEGHPTPKCVAMIVDAILDVTHRGDIVLDPTLGSGTTLVAAHRTGRRGYGLEIDPCYVDTAIRRLERLTGAPARHAETGLTFAETAAARSSGDGGDAADAAVASADAA